MIISHKYKCIFIRIPKTGSTSVETYLKEVDPDCISSDDKPPYGHETCSQLIEKHGHTIWNSYYKFTFIREPYQWYKSYYSDLLNYSWDEGSELAKKSLDLFLTDYNTLPEPVNGTLHEKHIMIIQLLNDFWFYPSIYDKIMDNHVTQISWIDKPINFIGRTEFLDDDFKDVCNKLNIPFTELKRLNTSDSHKLNHSEGSKRLIKCLAEKDLELYYNIKPITNNRY